MIITLLIDEEVEEMRETDNTMHCWDGDWAAGCLQGSPLTSSRILAPSELRKVERLVFLLGCDE